MAEDCSTKFIKKGLKYKNFLPQNLKPSKAWQEELGENWQEIQAKYLHTIGNLTLTGYNSALSDRPFKEKQDLKDGFADSPLRLNRMLAKLNHWNETEIKNRAEILAGIAIKAWSFPSVQLDNEKLLSIETASNSYSEYLQGEVLELFAALRQQILNLDASVREEYKKKYIAYKTATNFVDIVPQKLRIYLHLNLQFEEINDSKKLCKNVSNVGHWVNGDAKVGFTSLEQLDDVMFLVRQAFNKYTQELE